MIWGDCIFLTSAAPVSGEAALKLGLAGDIKPVEAEGEQAFYVQKNAFIAALDLGKSKAAITWSQDRSGNYMQTLLLDEGLAYFCFDNGVLSVYRSATGEKAYQQRLGPEYKLLAENDLGETAMATPAIADSVLSVRGRNDLLAIGAKP